MDEQNVIQGQTVIEGDGKRSVYAGETYYGISPVKRSNYNWVIGTSYFSIGLAGASQILSTVLDLSDIPDKKSMVRTGRYIALAGSLITPALYIEELGTPRKWYNMLRIVRPTSLMSTGGVWALTDFGISCGFAAMGQVLEDVGFKKTGSVLARIAGITGMPVAAFMSTYMGTELEETSTPLWAEASPMLPSLFGLNSASNALAVFELTGEYTAASEESMRPVRFLAMITEAAEIAQLRLIENRWTSASRASALYKARYKLLYRTGLVTLGKLAGVLLRAAEFIAGPQWKRFRPLASLLSLTTGFFLPTIILSAGNRSAERPEDYFEYTSRVRVEEAAKSAPLQKGEPGPPKTLSVMKWVAIGALALGAAAVVMRPKKAY